MANLSYDTSQNKSLLNISSHQNIKQIVLQGQQLNNITQNIQCLSYTVDYIDQLGIQSKKIQLKFISKNDETEFFGIGKSLKVQESLKIRKIDQNNILVGKFHLKGGGCLASRMAQEEGMDNMLKQNKGELDEDAAMAFEENFDQYIDTLGKSRYEKIITYNLKSENNKATVIRSINWLVNSGQIIYLQDDGMLSQNIDRYEDALYKLLQAVSKSLRNEKNILISQKIAEISSGFLSLIFKYYMDVNSGKLFTEKQKFVKLLGDIDLQLKGIKDMPKTAIEYESKILKAGVNVIPDYKMSAEDAFSLIGEGISAIMNPAKGLSTLISFASKAVNAAVDAYKEFDDKKTYKLSVFFSYMKWVIIQNLISPHPGTDPDQKIMEILFQVQTMVNTNESWDAKYGFCKMISELLTFKPMITLDQLEQGIEELGDDITPFQLWKELINKNWIVQIDSKLRTAVINANLEESLDENRFEEDLQEKIRDFLKSKNKMSMRIKQILFLGNEDIPLPPPPQAKTDEENKAKEQEEGKKISQTMVEQPKLKLPTKKKDKNSKEENKPPEQIFNGLKHYALDGLKVDPDEKQKSPFDMMTESSDPFQVLQNFINNI